VEKSLGVEYNNIFRKTNTDLVGEDIKMLSPLQLAYIGDAVYELFIRTHLLTKDSKVNILHRRATRYVKAKGQAEIVHIIDDRLTEEEKTLVKKGRNAKSHSSPKNADMLDYKYATGLECLFGYLYLTNQDERLGEIISYIKEFDL